MNIITSKQIEDNKRINHTAKLFGNNFPMILEPAIYSFAERLSVNYRGGYWNFYELSNSGFYMAPDDDEQFLVISDNGFEGIMSADAFGTTACLYAYSHLSFTDDPNLAKNCGRQYHLLREFMFDHSEAKNILSATD